MPLLTKKDLEEKYSYEDVRTYNMPVMLLNGVPMKARVMLFLNENELKAELDPNAQSY